MEKKASRGKNWVGRLYYSCQERRPAGSVLFGVRFAGSWLPTTQTLAYEACRGQCNSELPPPPNAKPEQKQTQNASKCYTNVTNHESEMPVEIEHHKLAPPETQFGARKHRALRTHRYPIPRPPPLPRCRSHFPRPLPWTAVLFWSTWESLRRPSVSVFPQGCRAPL